MEDIGLLHTTVRFGANREVATVSNGSLARSRIINATRQSKNAQIMTDDDHDLRESGGRCYGFGCGNSSSSGAIQQHLPGRSGAWDPDDSAQQQPSEDVRGMNIDFSGCLQQQCLGAEEGDVVKSDAVEVKSCGDVDGRELMVDGIMLNMCEPKKTR